MATKSAPVAPAGAAGRIFNFNAGPAVLPLPVLEQVQADLLNYGGTGMSVMEMSHRSKAFESILLNAAVVLRALMGSSDDYGVVCLLVSVNQHYDLCVSSLM